MRGAHLAACLGSVADLVDEIVVVDTGSTDGTPDVAARFGARVHEFTWVDSFAAAQTSRCATPLQSGFSGWTATNSSTRKTERSSGLCSTG